MSRFLSLMAAVIFSWSILTRPCSAALLAYDQFTGYSDGQLVGQGQGFGWGANLWTGSTDHIVSNSSGLTHSSLSGLTAGGSVSGPGSDVAGSNISRLLNAPLTTPGTYYFSVLLQQVNSPNAVSTDDPDNDPHNAVVGLQDSVESFSAGAWNSATTWQLQRKEGASGFGNVNSAVTESTNVMHFVMRINLVTGVGDTVQLFVNPADAAALAGAGNATYTFTNDLTPDRIWANLTNQNTSRGSYSFDEIRLGTAAEDMFMAIPEPNTCTLLAIGGGLLLGRFVRRRKGIKN